jgi:hypothetical protein
MKKLLPCIVLAAVTAALGQSVPHSELRSLSDEAVTLPDALIGRVTVLIIGFTRTSHSATSAWGQRVAKDFATSCDLYEIAALQDVPRFLRSFVVSGIRKGVPAKEHHRFLLLYDNQDQWKALVHFERADSAYVLLTDGTGRVVWKTSDTVDQKSLSALSEQLAKLRTAVRH